MDIIVFNEYIYKAYTANNYLHEKNNISIHWA